MGKYLDPKADLTFKKIFGEHKHLVISLLNAMLPLKEDERVESIEYWPAEKVPDRMQAEKDSIVDVCCKDNKKREFIVEMQMTWTDSFKKRVLLNASKAYVAQSKKGDDYELLQPVYALNFVNAVFDHETQDFYHHYQLVHEKYTERVIDGLQLVFIELPKFQPQTIAEKKMQVLWLRFLTEINDETREVPAELLENADVNEALEIVERAAFSDAEMRAYDKFWDGVSVQVTLENARKRELNAYLRKLEETETKLGETETRLGETETRLEETETKLGEAETRLKQKDIETARKLKAMNVMTVEQIAEITGLSNEEIERL